MSECAKIRSLQIEVGDDVYELDEADPGVKPCKACAFSARNAHIGTSDDPDMYVCVCALCGDNGYFTFIGDKKDFE